MTDFGAPAHLFYTNESTLRRTGKGSKELPAVQQIADEEARNY